MSSTTKRTGRTSLRSLISGRKSKDKGDNGSVVGSVADEDASLSSASSNMNGSAKQHQPREVRSTESPPTANAEASKTRRAVTAQPRDVRTPAPSPHSPPQDTIKTKDTAARSNASAAAAAANGSDAGSNENSSTAEAAAAATPSSRGRGGNVLQRLRERSRSRSRASARQPPENAKEMLVAVTSCRSDGYYNQKAPGSTSKLPRKAPTNLKLFHELAVGVKDAYAAVGCTPRNPTEEEKKKLEKDELEARMVLWDFVGNLDFVSSSEITRAQVRSITLTATNTHIDLLLYCLLLAFGFGGRSLS